MLHQKKTEINEEIEKLKLTAYQMKQLESSISEDAQAPIEKLINTHKYVIQNQRGMTLYMPLLYKLSPAIIIQYTSIIASVLLKNGCLFINITYSSNLCWHYDKRDISTCELFMSELSTNI